MSDPTDHDQHGSTSEPALGPASEVYRLHVGGAPGLLRESVADLRREHPRLLLLGAGAAALLGVSLTALLAARARR